MNCKEGDLALIVDAVSEKQHIGKIIKCVNAYDAESWICDPELLTRDGRFIAWLDVNLKPIRGIEGQDETLSWCDVPSKEVA